MTGGPDGQSQGVPCWVELHTSDPAAATAFYTGLFGWTYQDVGPAGSQRGRFLRHGRPVAGLTGCPSGSGYRDAWVMYLSTRSAAASIATALRHGGQLVTGPAEVDGLGTAAVLRDPAGALVGVSEAGSDNGFDGFDGPGTVGWLEHHSPDLAWSRSFYQQVFGWRIQALAQTRMIQYLQASVGPRVVTGLVSTHPHSLADNPSRWAVYFTVAEVDDERARVVQLGGSVLTPAESSPFVDLADVADPTGAYFKLQSAPV